MQEGIRNSLCAISNEFRTHEILIQGLAIHYHIGAMHPFLDGNGRTARALEATMLQRSGLKDALFISLSNYYYEEKSAYLASKGVRRRPDSILGLWVERDRHTMQKIVEGDKQTYLNCSL
jgi:Fic family protein